MANEKKQKKKQSKKKKEKSLESPESKSAFDLLNKKEKEFFLAYLKLGGNATKAYMSISPKTGYVSASVLACRMLEKVRIKAALKAYYDNFWKNKEDKIGEMFDDLYKASKADIHDVIDIKEGYLKFRDFDEVDTSIIQEVGQTVSQTPSGENVKNSIKLVDKQRARSEMLRILGMIQEKMKVTFNYDKESAQAIKDIFNESLASEKTDE